MNLFDLVAKITLDKSEYEKGLAGLKADAEKKQKDIQKGMLAATGVGVAALGAFAVSSVKTGAEFDKAMSQVAATMGVTVDKIGNLRDFAQQMGASTAFSATQAADALNYMALAGYDADKSMQMLPNVLNLAAAGGIELASASDMVTDAQSALGLTAEQTVEMVDQMAKAASKSNTSVEQLGSAFLTVGGTARSLSGGTVELSTALGLLADNGIKGAEGGTALRNVLMAIQGGKFEETFGGMGISAYDAAGNLRPLNETFADLNAALDGMTDQQRTEIISNVFNARDLKSVNALLNTSTERWNELTTAIDNSKGAAAEMASTQLDNLTGDITLLKSAWEGLQIQISEKLVPALRDVVQFITKLIENFDTIGPIIAGVATAFGVFSVAINIVSIIKSLTTSIAALNAVLAANPIGIIIALIAGVTVALIALWNNNEEFRNKVIEIWNSVKEFVIEAWNNVKAAFAAGAEELRNDWERVKSGVIALKDGIVTAFNLAKDKVNSIIDGIKSKLESLKEKFENVKDKVVAVWDVIKGILSGQISLPHIPLPHFEIIPPGWRFGDLLQGVIPSLGIRWYKKAYDTPYMFSKPTVMRGFGDGNGDEMVYGKNALMEDIRNAMRDVVGNRSDDEKIINIVVQSVLDGRVIGETAYKYQRGMARAMG